MWTRVELKSKAKEALSKSYLMGLLINLIVGVVKGTLLAGLFIGIPLEVGAKRFYVRASNEDPSIDHLGVAFNDSYPKVLGSMLWPMLFIFLWSFLFIIPGFVKGYSYSMVPYILADNPRIGYKRAIQLSMQMTRGHKFNMFLLDLSFLGWYLLGILAFLIGTIFVTPYYEQTKAQLYISLREEAIKSKICKSEELFNS